jgi:glycosyltransferase involved in cell wall biosynthesis
MPMAHAPEVTVIIPTRNRAELLPRALSAALRQEDVDLDVLVVDDCSTDRGEARAVAAVDPRVHVIRHQQQRGVAGARNTGIAEARGEWVAFLDDDDLWSPKKLRAQLDAADLARGSFAYSAAVVVDDRGAVRKLDPAPPATGLLAELLVRNAIPGGCSNLIARTDLVRLAGGFDEGLSVMADWDLWIRLARVGIPAACPEPLVGYVRHAWSMVLRGEHDVLHELDYVDTKYDDVRSALGVELDRQRIYRWLARAHRRGGRRAAAARVYLRGAIAYGSIGDLARAGGVLLHAERVTRSDAAPTGAQPSVLAPTWLSLYRRENGAGGSAWEPLPLAREHVLPGTSQTSVSGI